MARLDKMEWLLTCEEIRQAVYRYCAAIDRQEYQWMEQVFHPDATMTVGPYDGDAAAFFRTLQARVPAVRASHMIGNILFEPIVDDLVFVESYGLAVEQVADDAGNNIDRVVRLRYCDAFRRRDGVWKVEHRTIVVDHAMAPTPSATEVQFRGPQGTRDRDDPAMKMRAMLAGQPGNEESKS